ncbi:hypothetical protein C8J55DRAFT_227813 [Lentinula edodes]|uniref:Uncharacterized protein n=1 Tax=Lentinula lateritia TaxID=40482 RepID=A0A9W8ZUM5_9AGAR|nr:hypothetical protein C8J55DRAFT_227813 [Lentinula edodes]
MLSRFFPSSPSPFAFSSIYLLFFATAFFCIAFVNATPIPLPSTGFERCINSSGLKFRVAFYDQKTQTTTRSHRGILILCIGQINCFGYTSAGTVIRPQIQYRTSEVQNVDQDMYYMLKIVPNYNNFNVWSPKGQPKLTLVEFLTSIVDFKQAMPGTEINSEISYILAVLDYLQTNQMLVRYEKEGIKLALEQIKSTQIDAPKLSKIPGRSRLSWGFYSWSKKAWVTASRLKLPPRVKFQFLCFGVQHCFGLDRDGKVQDIAPKPGGSLGSFADTRYHLAWDNPKENPTFNLKKFEEFSKTSTFFTRLFSTPFADIEPAIKKEIGLKKGVDEDENTFFFRALLKYMASKEIITNYNEQTYDQEIKDLELIRTKDSKAPTLLDNSNTPRVVGSGSTQAGAPEGSGNNSSVGGSTRVTVSSLLRPNATFDPSISNLLN